MLAHQFSVSPPPPRQQMAIGKKQLMRDTIAGAIQFAFSHLGEWCLVGEFSLKDHGLRKVAYARAYYYHERLSTTIAKELAYNADTYPVLWDITWNKRKKQYEVRMLTDYRPDFAYGDVNELAESYRAGHYEMTGAEVKQSHAIKQAMDSIFFGGQ